MQNEFLGGFPKYALEALGMIFIAIVGYYIKSSSTNASSVIPVLGTIALGAQRLLPSLQQVFVGWASIKSRQAHVQKILGILRRPFFKENLKK